MTLHRIENQRSQFCALVYNCPQDPDALSLENVIVILVERGSEQIEILVRPNWRTIVEADDREYVQELLSDLKDRSLLDSENLLKHASLLSIGPLLTYAAGPQLVTHEGLMLLSRDFEKV
jgi:hypothetical protein